MGPLSKLKSRSSAIAGSADSNDASDSSRTGLTSLTWLTAVISILIGGSGHASELQVFSVKENPAGTVVAKTGIFTEVAPSASAFQLRFDDKHATRASEVRPAPSSAVETSVILCVDQSGSMGSSGIKQIQEALRGVLAKSELQLNLALWAFDTEVRKLRGFSKNSAQVAKGISEIGVKSTRDSKTKLYEAIELGLSELRSHDDKGLKRLIVITDGKDDGSSITDQVVASKANAQSITIYAIGFGNVTDEDSQLLARLTKNTGGRFIPAGNAQELSRALHQLLNLPTPRVFDVSFHYDVSEDGRQIDSAQLEFTPAGKAPVLQTIVYGLSAPRVASPPVSGPSESSDKWTINLLSINFDLRLLLAILIGIVVLMVIVVIKRPPPPPAPLLPTPPPPKAPPPPPPKRARTSVGFAFPAPSQGRPAAILHCLSGPARGRHYPIEQTTYRIGSGESNDLQLSDDYLSNKHASIKYDDGNLYLSDSGSRNGTFLNDVRLDQTAKALTPGDRIRVGKSMFELGATDEDHGVRQARQYDADGGEQLVP
ncbi:MAG: FHA domain-containing protein [Nitrosospira sp.]